MVVGGKGCDLIHTRCKKQLKKINAPATEKSSTVRKKTLTKKDFLWRKKMYTCEGIWLLLDMEAAAGTVIMMSDALNTFFWHNCALIT